MVIPGNATPGGDKGGRGVEGVGGDGQGGARPCCTHARAGRGGVVLRRGRGGVGLWVGLPATSRGGRDDPSGVVWLIA